MMKIIEKRLSELREYENNPRHNDHAVDYVANSIREFGFRVPIIIDRNGEIVAGHTRFKAAQSLGLRTVPCVVADDLTEEQVVAFRMADNKTAELANWDFEKLDEELREIVNCDMSEYGFARTEDVDIDDLFKEDTPNEKRKRKKLARCPHCGGVVEI